MQSMYAIESFVTKQSAVEAVESGCNKACSCVMRTENLALNVLCNNCLSLAQIFRQENQRGVASKIDLSWKGFT